jgi:hypothetical protein
MASEFSCHLCRSSSVIFRHDPLQCATIPKVLVFGHCSSWLMASSKDFCYAVTTLETAAMDKSNKTAVSVTDASA